MLAGFSGNKLTRWAMTALMALGSPVYADAPGGGGAGNADPAKGAPKCAQKLYKKCEDLVKATGGEVKAGVDKGGQQSGDGGNNLAGVVTAGAALKDGGEKLKGAGQQCGKMADECATACAKKEEEQDRATCKKHFEDRAAQLAQSGTDLGSSGDGFGANAGARGASPNGNPGGTESAKPQSTPSSGGGGGGGMGAGMMGAMAGMAAGMMMAQMMNKDQDQQQQQALNTGAIQADGSVNCSAPDAVGFSACNQYFSASCTAAIAAGAFSTSAGCQQFAARYCSAPNASAAQVAQAAQSGLPVVGVTGEGLGENPAFCQKVLASNFCAQPGRAGCPSCQSLSAQLGSACTTNPALCIAQSSTTTLETARLTCPTDPMFANPAYAIGGTATVVTGGSGLATSTPVTGGTIVGGAPVVLPQSAGSATPEGVTRSTASTGMSAQSVVGRGGTMSARAAVAYNAANNAGPAPDVQGQFGPSLFSTSSLAIRSRCESGQLNCR